MIGILIFLFVTSIVELLHLLVATNQKALLPA